MTTTAIARTIGRLAAVGAVAMALAGTSATATGAERNDTVRRVNGTIGDCFSAGGDATVVDFVGVFVVSCQHGNGFGWYQIVE